jgi:hypothetical protein
MLEQNQDIQEDLEDIYINDICQPYYQLKMEQMLNLPDNIE